MLTATSFRGKAERMIVLTLQESYANMGKQTRVVHMLPPNVMCSSRSFTHYFPALKLGDRRLRLNRRSQHTWRGECMPLRRMSYVLKANSKRLSFPTKP